jgi:hypothetical protein
VANNTGFFQGEEFFGDAVFLRVQSPRAGEHGGGATCVDVMYNAVERLGRGGAKTQKRWKFLKQFCTWGGRAATAAAVSGLQGLTKEQVLGLVDVRPEAACRTCYLARIIESSNFARKSMPRIGVATAASKNSNSKLWPAKQTVRRRRPQAGIGLPLAPTRCRAVGSAELECGRIEIDAPESTKNLKLFCES